MLARYTIGAGVVLLHLALVHQVMQTTETAALSAPVETLVGRFEVRTAPPPIPVPTPPPPAATPALPPTPAPSPKPVRNEPVPAAAPSATATQRSVTPVEQTVASSPSPEAPTAAQPANVSAPAVVNAPVAATAPAAAPELPARSAGPRTVSIGEVQYIKEPMPVYSSRSQRLGETGTVLLKVLIGADGHPSQVSVQRSSGFESLDRAAVQAMRGAVFKPFSQDGVPQAVWVQTPINFFLEPQS